MTTTTSSTRPDARRPSIAAVLLAIAGRIGWRMWWPLAVWLLVAGGARLWLATGPRTSEGDSISYVMLPGTVSLLAIPVMVAVLWFWGARFALALGHARSRVFSLTALSGFVSAVALHLIASAATVLEYRLVGEDGPRVFLTETSGFLGTNTSIINGATVMMAIYGLPLLGMLIVACAGFLGRGVVGGVVGMFGGLVIALGGNLMWTALSGVLGDSALSQALSGLVVEGFAIAAMMALGWVLFRSVRA